ncbi:MAG: glycosyltransferase family 1 protein [Deltaproteobacteria bacterium]|nr:glycosyltransferase family 1 protein [Deltaproteobacteria bacterium]
MNITIIAVGTHGDVQPCVALGLGLQAAGHKVRIAACANFEAFVCNRGLSFFSIGCDPREWLVSDEGRDWLKSSRNPIQFIRGLTRLMQPSMERSLADSWTACQGAEAIIYSLLAISGYHIAEKLRVPSFIALLHPVWDTRAFPNFLLPEKLRLGGTVNLLTHIVAEQLFWQPFRGLINEWREQTLGLPPAPFFGPWGRMKKQRFPSLFGYSQFVMPKPPDWGDWLHVTGYWFLDRPAEWKPPADLVDFLAAGPPPVYIGFGSVTDSNPEALTEMVLKAFAITGKRGILLTGWAGLRKADLPKDVFGLESIPHDWLFPQMAAVVHHGGAGTTAAGLSAGIPNIVIASQAEMYFWGRRVAALGAGPQPILRKELSAERLANAISIATRDTGIKTRAAALGQRIRAENGVANAVRAFHKHI